jgi:tetratricopeptide (TPR) repeat protein
MTLAELVSRANTWIEADRDLPGDVRAGVQSVLAYVTYHEGQEPEGLDMARRALERARAGRDDRIRVAALGNLSVLLQYAGRCEEAAALGPEWEQAEAGLSASREVRPLLVSLVGRARLASRCGNDPARVEALTARAAAMLPRVSDRELSRIDRASIVMAHAEAVMASGRLPEARKGLEAALDVVADHPDGDTVRLSLLRLLANNAAATGDFAAAARALEQAVALAPGRSTPFAEVRLKASWAARLAQAGERERGLALAREVLAEADRRASAFPTSLWMILLDVADAKMEAQACSEVPALLARVDGLAGEGMPTAWKVVRLKVEALCHAQAGEAARAAAVAADALTVGERLLSSAPLTKARLEALASGATRPPAVPR